MGNIKSIGLSEKYKKHRIKRIIYMREKADPPVSWGMIGKQLGIAAPTAEKIYEEAKREQK